MYEARNEFSFWLEVPVEEIEVVNGQTGKLSPSWLLSFVNRVIQGKLTCQLQQRTCKAHVRKHVERRVIKYLNLIVNLNIQKFKEME